LRLKVKFQAVFIIGSSSTTNERMSQPLIMSLQHRCFPTLVDDERGSRIVPRERLRVPSPQRVVTVPLGLVPNPIPLVGIDLIDCEQQIDLLLTLRLFFDFHRVVEEVVRRRAFGERHLPDELQRNAVEIHIYNAVIPDETANATPLFVVVEGADIGQ
jgi:hypothetical protein